MMGKPIKKIRGRALHAKLKTTIHRTGGKGKLYMNKGELEIENNNPEEDANQRYSDYHTECPDPDALYEEQFETEQTIDFDTIEPDDEPDETQHQEE